MPVKFDSQQGDQQKNAQDWVRQLRFSSNVNKQTMGVDTDRVTPQLLLASSNKLLGISRGQSQGDMKDSLQFQRIYGPVEYFAERIQKDGGSVARSMLWKATSKGNLDFIGSGSLQPHVNAVFHETNLSQFVDNSTPFDGIDNSVKVTRIGEGGVQDEDSVPVEMRLVQPSYYGYVDGVRCYDQKTEIYTKKGWISVKDMTEDTQFATLVDGKPQWNKPISITKYAYKGPMYGYDSQDIQYLVSPQHKMWVRRQTTKRIKGKRTKVWGAYKKLPIEKVHQKFCKVLSAVDVPMQTDQNQQWFYLPPVEGVKNITKNIEKVDIVDFAHFMGWYLSQGCCQIRKNWPASKGLKYKVKISQSPTVHPQYYNEIRDLICRLPFGATPKTASQKKHGLDLVINRKQLCLYCMQFGDSFSKFIPDWIFTAPTKAKWAFVQAILKGDGANQRDLCTTSKQLAKDFERLLFELGQSSRIIAEPQRYISVVTGKKSPDIYKVVWHKTKQLKLCPSNRRHRPKSGQGFYTEDYDGFIYCPTVPGGLVYVRRGDASFGIWMGNTADKSPGVTGYLTKNVKKGTDGKLYQQFKNMHTGELEWVDSQTAASKVVTTDEYLDSKDEYVYALGGPKGVRIVKRSDVDYILPNSDDAWSMASNTVPMLSGSKGLRLNMGCHHPETPILVFDENGYSHMIPAKRIGHMGPVWVLGCDKYGVDQLYKVRQVVTRLTQKKSKFKKIITESGRVLLTSAEHKWWVYDKGFKLAYADELKAGMTIPRSLFQAAPVRRTQICGVPVTREICILMGRVVRSLRATSYSYRVSYVKDPDNDIDQKEDIETALNQLGVKDYNFFFTRGVRAVSIKDPVFNDWIAQNIGVKPQDRRIPPSILSLPAGYTSIFLDSYYKDLQSIGQDSMGDTWLLSIANPALRDSLAFMLSKIETDSFYRDNQKKDVVSRAMQLVPMEITKGNIKLEKISKIMEVPAPAVMIDIDCDDNVYAAGNGIITHNSKYISQAVPLQHGEAPLVSGLDKASGKSMSEIVGKLLGSKWAPKAGMVKAVREDRIDMVYDDGTQGSVPLYKDFPANAKGWLSNYPKVKAGDKVQQGQLLASSNYTDDKGLMATGRNLRVGYLSYKGGTYEDGCTISQTAAKKMAYTTMYKTAIDKDKSIRTAKNLYLTWKPGQYTREQLQNISDDGVVKPGTVLSKGDPVILGIRTTEPSPGTLGKRILSDVTQVWQHAHPGVVTDVVNGKDGIRVYAKVSSPLQEGDKITGLAGNKGTCYSEDTQVLTKHGWKYFKDLTDTDEVATLGVDGVAHFEKPSARQVFDYQGQMYGFKNKVISWLVTPDHYMWTCPSYDYYSDRLSFKRLPVQQVWGQNVMCQTAALFQDTGKNTQVTIPEAQYRSDYSGSKQLTWSINDFAAFLGFYLAQGSIGHTNVVRITQKRDLTDPQSCLRCDKIQALLAKMNLPWRRDGLHYDITHKALRNYLKQFGKSYDKFIPEQVFTEWPHEAQLILLEWLYIGDGQKFGKARRLRVTSPKLIDDAQRLYILNGYSTTTHHDYPQRHRIYKGQQVVRRALHGVSFSNIKYRPMDRLTGQKTTFPGYYKQLYDGKVYCCTVSTGVILVQRQGKPMWCGNCAKVLPDDQMPKDSKGRPLEVLFDPLGIVSRGNPSALMQAALGKVAQKIGKQIVVPAFMPKGQSRLKYVKQMMKANNVPWKEDVTDPDTGRTIKNVFTGLMYFLPLKHIADTKMSARGTQGYTAQGVPASGGEHGCFTGSTLIRLNHGFSTIENLYESFSKGYRPQVLSWSPETHTLVSQITDFFKYSVRDRELLDLTVTNNHSQSTVTLTGNHKIFLKDGSKVCAQSLKRGDYLMSFLGELQVTNVQPHYGTFTVDVYDFTVSNSKDLHSYILWNQMVVSNSKRIGGLQSAALVGHNAFDFLTTDAKLIRGQQNHDFWRSLRSGQIPVIPGQPLVHKKFFAHLQGSGVQVKRDQTGVSIFALSNKDVNQLAGPRQLKSTDTYQQKSFRPISGGLFGTDVFGQNGDKWGYIQLDYPLPNPVMQEPLARLLNVTDSQFQSIIEGSQEVNGMSSAKDMKEALSKMDLQKETVKALQQLKESSPSKKDAALKRYVAIARMRDAGVKPQEYMLDRIPVLPPQFRPITSHGGLTMVADSNYLYSQLLNARDDLREAQWLPQEYIQQGQANLYRKWKELTGLYDPSDVKLKAKSVKGLLKWALGSTPKFSGFQRKVLGSTVDTVGRGVVIPSTKIKLNEIGMPLQMAWSVYSPFVTRKLVKMGYTPVDALKLCKERKPVAFEALQEAVVQRPVVMNRAPSLHKYSLMGFNVKLTNGHAIKVNPSIVSPFGMDFDGDSCKSLIYIGLEKSLIAEYGILANQHHQVQPLTNRESRCILSMNGEKQAFSETDNNTKGEHSMFKADTKMELVHTVMELSELPVVEGSEVKKSDTVTEWDVKDGVYANTIDPSTGDLIIAKITKVSKHENLKMFDCNIAISGSYSHIVTVSEDHSLITYNPVTLQLEKSRPEDSVGRCVPMTRLNRGNVCNSEDTGFLTEIQFPSGKYPITFDMGLLFGLLIGDGWVANISDRYQMYIACCEESLQNNIIELSKKANMPFTKEAALQTYKASEGRFSTSDMQRLALYTSNEDKEFIRELIGHGAENKHIPAQSFLANRAHLLGILMGLLATDGSVSHNPPTGAKKSPVKAIAYHTISPTLRDGVQELAHRLGVKTSVTSYIGSATGSKAYMVNFCLEDMVRLYDTNKSHFKIPVAYKQEAMERIIADIHENSKASCTKTVTSYDIVPFPRGLFCEFSWAGIVNLDKHVIIAGRAKGYIKRSVAKRIADALERRDWSIYKDPSYLKKVDQTHRTPEEAKAMVDKWISIVRDENISWEVVESVTPSTCTEGWDCTVPGPYTFSLNTGTVVQDTVNIHVPVSQAGIRDVRQKMLPERNLLSVRKHKIQYAPQKAYAQGLYAATRMGEAKDIKAYTLKEAQEAYRRGDIDIDTPIVIKKEQ